MKIHAHRTLPATRHRTADIRRAAPTPTIAPVMVCVVETGMPCAEAKKSVAAAALSAATPPDGCSLVSLNPIVFTIRHPPKRVPRAIAVCADRTTHSGTSASGGRFLTAMRTARMIPIVFWASLPPCPRLKRRPMRADRGEIPCSVVDVLVR